ncbi:unnamed protein product [Closterium sp. NIES-53]
MASRTSNSDVGTAKKGPMRHAVDEVGHSETSKPLREKCWRVTHDVLFSDWKLLIAADDWSTHAQGVPGTTRYRIANLPSQTGPGVYELGVLPNRVVRRQRRLQGLPVRVVYVGHSESVRSRMQQYGQSGSHLKELFEGVFAEDYSLTFRWTSAATKAEAAAMETLLLSSFDYVWNVGNNHHRRHDRLLTKLQVGSSFSRRVAVAFPFLPVARLVTPVAVGPSIPLAAAAAAPPYSPTASRAASSAAISRPDVPSAIAHANYSAAKPQDRQPHDRPPGTPPGRPTDKTPDRSPGRTPEKRQGDCGIKVPQQVAQEQVSARCAGDVGVVTCGAPLVGGGTCQETAVKGRVRCAAHKGIRVKGRGGM